MSGWRCNIYKNRGKWDVNIVYVKVCLGFPSFPGDDRIILNVNYIAITKCNFLFVLVAFWGPYTKKRRPPASPHDKVEFGVRSALNTHTGRDNIRRNFFFSPPHHQQAGLLSQQLVICGFYCSLMSLDR